MIEFHEKAYAKLNISLDICGKRDDGYHEMKMVMQTVELCDDVRLKVNDRARFSAKSNFRFLPNDRRNITLKAAGLFFERGGLSGLGADVTIRKRIPVCAGLGGGSSDGAAVLRGLNRAYDNKFSVSQLMEMASELGSDVPFCVQGGTQLALGRGEIMTELQPLPDCHIVLCKPNFSVSTPKLFERVNLHQMKHHPDTLGLISALNTGELSEIARRAYNVFEDILPERFRDISAIKARLLEDGALGAAMSGTGPAVFGIFQNEELAQNARQNLRKDYRECFLTKPKSRIPL